jgi:uncharacterized membrane protein
MKSLKSAVAGMNLTTSFAEQTVSGALLLGTAVAAGGSYLGFLEPDLVAAAFCGSVTAILYRIVYDQDKQDDTPFKATLKLLVMFTIASVFGMFMGASISAFSPLDRVGATFMGGLLGFGLVGGLLAPQSVKKLTEWFINSLARRGKD